MTLAASPFRYPGGKATLLDLTAQILYENDLTLGRYAEPFAGGCGLALGLLYGGLVSEIYINDIDRAVWAFWYSALNLTKKLVEKIEQTEVSINEWKRQRDIYRNDQTADILKLGFSTFFLNRTNRSGIIKGASVIGGLDQTGDYKLDCRYNKQELIRRILRVSKYANRIHLFNLDALIFIKASEKYLDQNSLLFIDPPYFKKGSVLYTNFYDGDDHHKLAQGVAEIATPWVVTYDDAPEIKSMYKRNRQFYFDLKYSVQTKRIGTEVMVASKGLRLPKPLRLRPAKILRGEQPGITL